MRANEVKNLMEFVRLPMPRLMFIQIRQIPETPKAKCLQPLSFGVFAREPNSICLYDLQTKLTCKAERAASRSLTPSYLIF